ncbi:MAG: WD40 repeat domain-containing protein, partial [Anaerolineae bacterium]|nr:WD40 repeat domain-containing protein [Anaerolineae bacterium]
MALSLPPRFMFILAGCVVMLLAVGTRGEAAPEGLIPINITNVGDIQLLSTIEDYQDNRAFCGCDVRFFSQNGRAVATDRKVRDLVTGDTLDLTGHGYPIALDPEGTHVLVSGDYTGTRLVEIATGMEQPLLASDAEDALFSPDGRLIAITSRDADAIQVWQTANLELVATLGQAKPYVDTHNLEFTSDSRYLLWSDRNDNLNLWDTEEQTTSWQIATNIISYQLSADQRTLVLLKSDFETLEVWDIEAREMVSQVVDSRDQSGVENFAISPERHTLAIMYYGGNARLELWNIAVQPAEKIVELDEQYGYGLEFTRDGRYLIVSG